MRAWPKTSSPSSTRPGLSRSKCRRSRRRPFDDGQARIDLDDLRESLRALMWRRVGITRDAAGLNEAADRVDHWGRYILPLEFDDPTGWTMQNMLIVARLMIAAAAAARGIARRPFPPRFPPARPGDRTIISASARASRTRRHPNHAHIAMGHTRELSVGRN